MKVNYNIRNRVGIRQIPVNIKRRLIEMFDIEEPQGLPRELEAEHLCPSRLNRK